MNKQHTRNKPLLPFCVLLLSLLFIQTLGSYIGKSFLAIEGFKTYWVIGRLVIPFVIILVLGIPIAALLFSPPQFNKASWIILAVAAAGLVFLTIYLQFFAEDYLKHYRRGRSLEQLQSEGRFIRFLIFTASTLIGWEILHRGFLLGGGRYCLVEHGKVPEQAAIVIMIIIIIVCIFEVLFHIKKPIYEAISMLIASPLLSYLTIQCRSLWPALTIHLAIELIFGFSAFYYSVA